MKAQQLTTKTFEPFNNSQGSLLLGPLSNVEQGMRHTELSLLASQFTRRGFIKRLGLLTGSVMAFDTLLFSKEAEAIDWYWWGKAVWWTTKALARALLPIAAEYGADYITQKIDEAQMLKSPSPADFHQQFSDPMKLDLVEPPLETLYSYYFGINGHSQTGPEKPIPSRYELNVFEIQTIVDKRNPINYAPDGSPFVPYPHEKRRHPNSTDKNAFFGSSVISDRYRVNPHEFTLEYVRCFSNRTDLLTGYGVRTRQHPYDRYFLLVGGRV